MGDRSASIPEFRPVAVPAGGYDVAILGGGLAGLALALQIKRGRPDTTVFVAEKRHEPAPEAAFKVGESTSESGAHYLREVLDLDDHLREDQLTKFGLRFFMPAGDNTDIARRVEFASPRTDGISTYQLDRGRLENELWSRCVRHGVMAVRGCRVTDVEVGEDGHELSLSLDGAEATVTARWLVDATGRSNLLKRKLGLEKDTGHVANAAWFRLGGGLDVEDWSQDEEWLDRMPERGQRRHSTVHLVGEGYWVWLIQLASGPISVGICADPRFHPFEAINTFDALLEWLRQHEPQLAAAIEGKRDEIRDFLVVSDFSYGCERVYSPQRWCLAGEAAAFLDPLYSPGTDYIGYGNSWITDLVARDLAGEDVANRVEFYNFVYLRMFNTGLQIYEDQYGVFGNAEVMVSKLLFNTFVYFATLPLLFRNGKLQQPEFMATVIAHLDRLEALIGRMERLWRDWHALGARAWEGVSLLSREWPAFREVHADLVPALDDDTLRSRLERNMGYIHALAVVMFHRALRSLDERPIADDVPINPQGISLSPDRWQEEGLFSEPGISLAAANELLPGVEEFWLDQRGAVLTAG